MAPNAAPLQLEDDQKFKLMKVSGFTIFHLLYTRVIFWETWKEIAVSNSASFIGANFFFTRIHWYKKINLKLQEKRVEQRGSPVETSYFDEWSALKFQLQRCLQTYRPLGQCVSRLALLGLNFTWEESPTFKDLLLSLLVFEEFLKKIFLPEFGPCVPPCSILFIYLHRTVARGDQKLAAAKGRFCAACWTREYVFCLF